MDNENITVESEITEENFEDNDFEFGATDDSEDSWDDIEWGKDEEADEPDDGEAGEEEAAGEDQPEAEAEPETEGKEPAETEPADDTKPEAQPDDTDQYLELKHFDEVRKVNKEEAKRLAQMGLDYERIKGERDAMKSDYQTLKGYEAFLNELKGNFPSIDALMNDTRARLLSDKEGISYADAMAKVQNQKPAQPQPSAPADKAVQGNEAVQKFVDMYPNVKAEDIPQSVWDEVRTTGDLVGAYSKYEASKKDSRIAALEAEINTLKQNAKNERRSTGSSSSSGKTSAKSLIQSLWEEDD